jgi:hypothetical protein
MHNWRKTKGLKSKNKKVKYKIKIKSKLNNGKINTSNGMRFKKTKIQIKSQLLHFKRIARLPQAVVFCHLLTVNMELIKKKTIYTKI